jgi:hypothetical protein
MEILWIQAIAVNGDTINARDISIIPKNGKIEAIAGNTIQSVVVPCSDIVVNCNHSIEGGEEIAG